MYSFNCEVLMSMRLQFYHGYIISYVAHTCLLLFNPFLGWFQPPSDSYCIGQTECFFLSWLQPFEVQIGVPNPGKNHINPRVTGTCLLRRYGFTMPTARSLKAELAGRRGMTTKVSWGYTELTTKFSDWILTKFGLFRGLLQHAIGTAQPVINRQDWTKPIYTLYYTKEATSQRQNIV